MPLDATDPGLIEAFARVTPMAGPAEFSGIVDAAL